MQYWGVPQMDRKSSGNKTISASEWQIIWQTDFFNQFDFIYRNLNKINL